GARRPAGAGASAVDLRGRPGRARDGTGAAVRRRGPRPAPPPLHL
ncbi:MAG: hypothetical protein AVDCRST_MAG54-4930, partial [uncultured Actinomycetospora sp.]